MDENSMPPMKSSAPNLVWSEPVLNREMLRALMKMLSEAGATGKAAAQRKPAASIERKSLEA